MTRKVYFRRYGPILILFLRYSNLHRLRDFIKHVYVDRKYTGERGHDKLPAVKTVSIYPIVDVAGSAKTFHISASSC